MFKEISQILLTNKKRGKTIITATFVFTWTNTYVCFNGKVEEPQPRPLFWLDLSMLVNESHIYLVTHDPLTERAINHQNKTHVWSFFKQSVVVANAMPTNLTLWADLLIIVPEVEDAVLPGQLLPPQLERLLARPHPEPAVGVEGRALSWHAASHRPGPLQTCTGTASALGLPGGTRKDILLGPALGTGRVIMAKISTRILVFVGVTTVEADGQFVPAVVVNLMKMMAATFNGADFL